MFRATTRAWLAIGLILPAFACTSPTLNISHAQISASPAALNFGTTETTATEMLTLSNTGSASLDIRSVAITGDTNHVFSVQGGGGTLASGASRTLTVTMTPPAQMGPYDALLVITSNAQNTTQLDVPLLVLIAPPPVDAGIDAGMDAGPPDAGTDAGMDAGIDAGDMDAGVDAGIDAGVDAGPPDAGTDAGETDAGCPTGQMMCSEGCTNTNNDPENCGGCDQFCNTAGTGCVNGNCVACAPTTGFTVLAQNQGQPTDMRVDSTNVYWTDETDETVVKVGVDGGTPVTLVDASEFTNSLFQPQTLGLDSSNVYFSNQEGPSSVWQAALSNGTLLNNGGSGSWPGKLAVDSSGVYWVITTTGEVWHAAAGGLAVTLVAAPASQAGGQEDQMLGTDANNVYWLTWGTPDNSFTDGAIYSTPKSGPNSGTTYTVASGLNFPFDGAVYSGNIYWDNRPTSGNGMVLKVSTSGGMPTTLATALRDPRNLVVDSSGVYWSAGGTDSSLMYCDGTVESTGLDSGPVVDLVSGQYAAYAVATDSTYLYWTDLFAGTVMKTTK